MSDLFHIFIIIFEDQLFCTHYPSIYLHCCGSRIGQGFVFLPAEMGWSLLSFFFFVWRGERSSSGEKRWMCAARNRYCPLAFSKLRNLNSLKNHFNYSGMSWTSTVLL